jgi:hypothetical protein
VRRVKLVWFALGAGAAACAFVASNWFFRSTPVDQAQTAYIVLAEPISEAPPDDDHVVKDTDSIANTTGQLLRDCGSRVFETTFLYDDHGATADFPIIPENFGSLECVINAVRDQDIGFEVEVRSPPKAADEMRSASNAQKN